MLVIKTRTFCCNIIIMANKRPMMFPYGDLGVKTKTNQSKTLELEP
jgi:hypothetical protein